MKKFISLSAILLCLVAITGTLHAAAVLPVTPYQGGTAVSSATPLNVTIGNGTNQADVTAASTAPTAAQKALVVAISPNGDPCQNPAIAKTTAAVAATSSSTAYALVAKATSKVIYVCEVTGSLSGTTPTIKFTTGTRTSAECDTNAADLSGTVTPSAGSMVSMGRYGGTVMKSASGSDLCVTTGATSAFNGIISYVQQ
jgi:hypothetical protein